MREQDYYERGYDDEPRRSKKAKKRKRKQSGSDAVIRAAKEYEAG